MAISITFSDSANASMVYEPTGSETSLQSYLNSNGYTINKAPIDVQTDQRYWGQRWHDDGYYTYQLTFLSSTPTGTSPLYLTYAWNASKSFGDIPLGDVTTLTPGTQWNLVINPTAQTWQTMTLYLDDDLARWNNTFSESPYFQSTHFPYGLEERFLAFDTDQGLLLAMEWGAYDSASGLFGDQDYNDVIVLLNGGTIPEPTSACLLLGCCAMLVARPNKRRRVA